MKKCLVICGGDFYEVPRSLYDNADFVVACDKGYEYSKQLGFTPDLIIGDFDSCSVVPSEADAGSESKIIKLSRDKDDTDTMCGVKYAVEQGCTDFTFICAFGGRFDHLFCNLQVLSYVAERFSKACLFSQNEEIWVIKDSSKEVERRDGWSLSVFSLCDKSEGVFEKGTKWQLSDAVMKNNEPYGISNEWISETAEIGVKKGMLAVILSKMENRYG